MNLHLVSAILLLVPVSELLIVIAALAYRRLQKGGAQ